MYGYIYLTENLINGKCYIGKHKSEVFDIKYKGSGILIQHAFDKYGWDNFICQPIQWCETLDTLNHAEEYWIRKCDAYNSKCFYNIADGGQGGNLYQYLDRNAKMIRNKKISDKTKGVNKSPEHIAKIKSSILLNSSHSGSRNGMYGKSNKPNIGKHIYNNGEVEIFIYDDQISYYEDLGYIKGRIKKHSDKRGQVIGNRFKNTISITDGFTNKRIHIEELDSWINKGFRRGHTIHKEIKKLK